MKKEMEKTISRNVYKNLNLKKKKKLLLFFQILKRLNSLISSTLHTISDLPNVIKFINCHKFLSISKDCKKNPKYSAVATHICHYFFVCLHNKFRNIHKTFTQVGTNQLQRGNRQFKYNDYVIISFVHHVPLMYKQHEY